MQPKPDGVTEALEDRDPNSLNQHLQIVWDDIIGEPEGARSPECAWRLSNLCFRHTRNWCYTLLSVLIAPPCALLLGCGFACLAFEIVWGDISGEPEGARSPECAWRLSNLCFRHTRNWCYTLLSVLIAPPCALLLGCGFACLAFEIFWDDIIGEPEGARSPECAWRLSNLCFRHTRNWCYTLLSVLSAPPCALLLGCGFACLAFEQIWCTTPCLRCLKIYFASLRTVVQSCMAATVAPCMEAVGHVCRHVRVNVRKDAPEDRDLLIV